VQLQRSNPAVRPGSRLKRVLGAKLAVVSAFASLSVLAQPAGTGGDYPNKAIDLYIGSAPSGSTDAIGRVLARSLSDVLGQPVVVHNTPGAGGAVMATHLLNSPPDGYSLGMVISQAYTGNPIVMPEATQYTVDDFTHLATVSRGQCALVTHSSEPYQTLEDVIEAARRGEQPVYASQSPLTRIVADYISSVENVKFRIITVQGGGEIMQAILGRHADFGFSGGPHIDFVAAGEMRVLASVEEARLITSPDVPTLRELGYDMSACSMFVVSAPPGLPPDLEATISAALERAIGSEPVKTLIRNLKYPEYYLGPEEVTRALQNEARTLARAVERIRGLPEESADGELSPTFMPWVATVLLLGAGALIVVSPSRRQAPIVPSEATVPVNWLFVGSAALVLAGAFVTMNLFGYLPGAAVIVAGFMLLGRAGIRIAIVSAVAFPIVLWLLFSKLLGFPLP
jgi:tripartite-type tricarboxylate transporter receptor subunit TctC